MGTNSQSYLKHLFKQIRFKNKWAEPAKPIEKALSPDVVIDISKGEKSSDNL